MSPSVRAPRAGARVVAALVVTSLCASWGARAQAPTPDGGVGGLPDLAVPDGGTPDAAPPSPDLATPAPAKDSLDFDLFGDAPKPGAVTTPGTDLKAPPTGDALRIAKQVKTRRLMLQLHQGFGFATLGLLAVTLVLGQLNYVDKFGGGDFTERYQYPHLGLAMATSAFFATDAILAVAAPTPYKKPIRADAALLHKVMMSLATAGMVTQLALGFVTASQGGELIQRDLALAHMVVGYATFASMLTGYLAYVF